MLFNLVLEYAVRKVLALDIGLELNRKHAVIGYADDLLALLGETKQDIAESVAVLETEAKKVGLSISHEKSEYLHMKRYKNTRVKREDLHVGDTTYKGVAKFRYLGYTVTDTNTREEKIDIRIQNALRCSAALHKVLVSKLLSKNTKLRIYKTVIRPILMYGCETWTLTLKEESKLLVAERRILRKILGPFLRSWRSLALSLHAPKVRWFFAGALSVRLVSASARCQRVSTSALSARLASASARCQCASPLQARTIGAPRLS
ncbi:uncharacterized protein LOC134741787 [Cydia strobilella]|uniref:uncharacterized protein LOC134741787 n=1 Tax=Cydia strobilella TaxID=1100964 RepID=UPI003006E673